MKTRNGFVSNSSSSSFIIAFDKQPKYSEEVWKAMFPTDEDIKRGVPSPYDWNADVDCGTASTLVWQQIEKQKPLTKAQMLKELNSGCFEGYPDIWNRNLDEETRRIRDEYQKLSGLDVYDKGADPKWTKKYSAAQEKVWKEEHKLVRAAAKALFDREYPRFKGKKVFVVSFSDNDGGVFTTMEHGQAFRNIPHIRISHH